MTAAITSVAALSLSEGKHEAKILERLGCRQLTTWPVHGLNRPEHLDQPSRGMAKTCSTGRERAILFRVGFSSHGSQDLTGGCHRAAGDFPVLQPASPPCWIPQRLPALRALRQRHGDPGDFSSGQGRTPAGAESNSLRRDCAPFHPLQLAYRFLLAQGISTLSIGAAKASDLTLAAALQQWGSSHIRGTNEPATTG